MIEVRLDIRAGGEVHRGQWSEVDDNGRSDTALRRAVCYAAGVEGDGLVAVTGTERLIPARSIDWVDVAVRRR